jgi:hypothetical protein
MRASGAGGRGPLGRDVLARLGKSIEGYFNELVEPEVPPRFKALLERMDEPRVDERPRVAEKSEDHSG